MFVVMISMAFVFVLAVYFLARVVVLHQEQKADEDVLKAKNVYQEIIDQKERAIKEKTKLEKEAAQIFTLYEMTRDINKSFDEAQAFAIFRQKARDTVPSAEFDFMDVSVDKLKEVRSGKEWSVFPLKSKEKKLGYLIYKGVASEDKEKFLILCHQFALSFRRIKLYHDVEFLAITDSLTEVHTRRYFMDRLKEEVERAGIRKSPFSIVMLDVDHFKSFNDQYGHLTGDRILKRIGQIIKENIREIDIAGRYGGEEFCVALPETDLDGAILAAERIRIATQQAVIQAYDQSIKTTISLGVATFPGGGRHADELLDNADWALYRAKALGRNRTVAFGKHVSP